MNRPSDPERRGLRLLFGALGLLCLAIVALAWRMSSRRSSGFGWSGCEEVEPPPKIVSRPPPGGGGRQVALVGNTSCALMRDGSVWCWGASPPGAAEPPSYRSATVRLLAPSNRRAFALGNAGRCDVPEGGPAHCSTKDGESFTLDAPKKVAIGYDHACAIVADGSLHCWGDNAFAQLFEPDRESTPMPRARSSVAGVRDVALGPGFTCVVFERGALECRGVAQGTKTREALSRISLATAIAAGDAHACVVADGRVSCWGKNEKGQLGDGTTNESEVPVDVKLPGRAVQLAAFAKDTCAILETGTPYCWGEPGQGPYAIETRTEQGALADATSIAVGANHACILRRDGRISCWGDNSLHQVSSKVEPIWSQEQSSHNCYPVHWSEPSAVGVTDVFWGPP